MVCKSSILLAVTVCYYIHEHAPVTASTGVGISLRRAKIYKHTEAVVCWHFR